VEGPTFGIYRSELSAVQHLEYIRRVQTHWVQAGRRHERYSPGLHHNVSCTVTVRPEEWEEVAATIWRYRDTFTGIALLTETGDKDYEQAPREAVQTPEDIVRWNTLTHEEVDYTTLIEDEDITELKAVAACAGGTCELHI
jgi:ribonucleoside-triphosphate reductase